MTDDRIAALSATPAPSGWKLVPAEPTEEMLDAWSCVAGYSTDAELVRGYAAMIEAAPAPGDQDASQAQGEVIQVAISAIKDRRDNGGGSDSYKLACNHAIEVLTALSPAPGATAQDGVEDGQDRKFAFRNGQYVNRVSGEPIPHDEPIIIFRARDHHSIHVLREYLTMVTDEHHRQAIRDRMAEFSAYAAANPERMKEPGITHDIRHNEPTPTIPAGMVAWVPQIGERVRVTDATEFEGDWRHTDLWVSGVAVHGSGDGLDVTVAEEWPVYPRRAGYNGQTDGWRVGATSCRDHLAPLATDSHQHGAGNGEKHGG